MNSQVKITAETIFDKYVAIYNSRASGINQFRFNTIEKQVFISAMNDFASLSNVKEEREPIDLKQIQKEYEDYFYRKDSPKNMDSYTIVNFFSRYFSPTNSEVKECLSKKSCEQLDDDHKRQFCGCFNSRAEVKGVAYSAEQMEQMYIQGRNDNHLDWYPEKHAKETLIELFGSSSVEKPLEDISEDFYCHYKKDKCRIQCENCKKI